MIEARITCVCSEYQLPELGLVLHQGQVVWVPEQVARKSSQLTQARRAGAVRVHWGARCDVVKPVPPPPQPPPPPWLLRRQARPPIAPPEHTTPKLDRGASKPNVLPIPAPPQEPVVESEVQADDVLSLLNAKETPKVRRRRAQKDESITKTSLGEQS